MSAEAAPNAAPAAPAAPAALPNAPSYAAAAAKALAAVKAESAPAPAPAATPAAVPATPAPGIETKGLQDLTRLSSENRALQAKVRELEPAAKDAALLKEVRDLYASGKKVAAIGKLAGADPTAEMEGLLADYLGNPNDPVVQDKLAAKVDEVAKRIDDSEKANAQRATEAEHAKAANGVVIAQMSARLDKLPHIAKADRDEAVGKILSAVTRLREDKQLSLEASTPEVMTAILADAMDEVEIEYEIRAARAARASGGNATPAAAAAPAPAATAAPAAEPTPSIESLERPGVSTAAWGATLTHDKAKEKLRALVRQGGST